MQKRSFIAVFVLLFLFIAPAARLASAQEKKDSLMLPQKHLLQTPDTIPALKDKSTMQQAITKRSASLPTLPEKSSAAAFVKKQWLSIQPKGSISAGYEYGVLPYVTDDHYPSGGFKTEGNISLSVLKLPLQLNYYYTSIRNTIGLTNYFRISYDANRYRDQLGQKVSAKEQGLNTQLGLLKTQQQAIQRKLSFLDFMEKNPGYKAPVVPKSPANKGIPAMPEPPDHFANNTDTSRLHIPGGADSLYNKRYSYKQQYGTADSTALSAKHDSILQQIGLYRQKYDSIGKEMDLLHEELNKISNYKKNAALADNPYLSKTEQFLGHIKKFEIGLCHPSSSLFLVNNIPLQGINVEYEKTNHFVNVLYGTTLNNLLFNPHTLDGAMQGARNYYNYFDFGNLEAGRKIFAMKGGLGSKEGTHLFAGFMIGRGKSDYLLPVADGVTPSKQSNLVLELDGKYKFSSALSAELVLGKSSVQEEDVSASETKKALNEIFSDYRSYALMLKLNETIKQTRTNITVSTRWIDPYFKSFGIGFMRSDNLRYELKAEQVITPKIKYTLAFRREEDNLLRLYDYKNTFYTVSNTLNLKLSRQFNLRLIYSPLYRELRYGSHLQNDKNNISTVLASWMPKLKKINIQFNALYSHYLVKGDSGNINFDNFTYSHQLLFRSGFKTDLAVSWFRNNLSDTLGNDTYLGIATVGYAAKNHNSISIGGKMAYKKGIVPQYGFVLKATLHLYRNLYYEASAEKIIIGDYYNSFDIQKIKQFPYYCSTRLILNF